MIDFTVQNADLLFAEIGERGYQLGKMFQVSYVMAGVSKNDAWEAHFHDAKGNWLKGFGRLPREALLDVLAQSDNPVKATALEDLI